MTAHADGVALLAARVLGCELSYMGTKFIATQESLAAAGHKAMLVDSRLDDVLLSRAFTGLGTNTLIPSIRARPSRTAASGLNERATVDMAASAQSAWV